MNTGIDSINSVNGEVSYTSSFGDTPDKTVYLHTPITEVKSLQIDKRLEIKSALTTSSPLMATGTTYSGTSGSIPVLLPTIVDPVLYDLTKRDTPLASGIIPRMTNKGLFADYITMTAPATAVVNGEMGGLNSSTATYARSAQKMSYIYAVGEVSGPMQVASAQQWKDALNLMIPSEYQALKELEENLIINGNPTVDDYDGSVTDVRGFTGLINGITTNTTNKSGAKISLQNITDAFRTIREAYGRPTICVTDYKTLSDVKGLIFDVLRYPAPTATVNFGIENILYEGVPIMPDLFMPTSGSGREMLILDTSSGMGGANIQMRVLQDAVFEELAKTSDSYKFMIKSYLTMIIVDETRCYRIYGCA
ncbi:MAG: DUF5309 domain-containing protein [Methanosarcinaceae archaeon]|nr:DUF5309 domain-containing protein [Methanosarcinaceae archaeon]